MTSRKSLVGPEPAGRPRRPRHEVVADLLRVTMAQSDLHLEQRALLAELAEHERDDASLAPLQRNSASLLIPLKIAAQMANRTPETIKAWCRRYGFGWQVGGRSGRWVVDRLEFLEHLKRRAGIC